MLKVQWTARSHVVTPAIHSDSANSSKGDEEPSKYFCSGSPGSLSALLINKQQINLLLDKLWVQFEDLPGMDPEDVNTDEFDFTDNLLMQNYIF